MELKIDSLPSRGHQGGKSYDGKFKHVRPKSESTDRHSTAANAAERPDQFPTILIRQLDADLRQHAEPQAWRGLPSCAHQYPRQKFQEISLRPGVALAVPRPVFSLQAGKDKPSATTRSTYHDLGEKYMKLNTTEITCRAILQHGLIKKFNGMAFKKRFY